MQAGACDVLGLDLWAYVGCLLLMFAVAWQAAQRLSSGMRPALRAVTLFNLLAGTSLVLVGLRGQWPFLLTHTLSNLMEMVGFVVLWHAGALLTGLPPARREQLALLLVGGGLVLWFGRSPDTEQQRVAVCFLVNAWAAWRCGWQVFNRLRHDGAHGNAAAVLVAALAIGGAMVARALAGLALDGTSDVDVDYRASQRLAYLSLVVVFAINIVIANHVFGRVVREVQRLSQRDPLTGLTDRGTVERALAFEWQRHARQGRPLAVLALAVDGLDALVQQWGSATADAVLAEVALLLRMRMRPGDVLGHAGGGLFLAVLPDTAAEIAARQAGILLRTVSADAGLFPDGSQTLTLSVGMAQAGPGDAAGPLLARAEACCRQAQAAGGNHVAGSAPPPVARAARPAAA